MKIDQATKQAKLNSTRQPTKQPKNQTSKIKIYQAMKKAKFRGSQVSKMIINEVAKQAK